MELAQSSCYNSNADSFENSGAIVTGIWNATAAEEFFGENFGVAKLPSFTVDGVSYQLGSYSGNKLMGVKPQQDPAKAAALSKLAQYLTGEECQMQRYNEFQWGPSNIAAQNTDAVKANPSLGALVAQNAHAVPQGNIHGSWWDIAKVLGAEAKAATSVADLQSALADYEAAINAVLQMTDEQKQAWSVIGNLKALRNGKGELEGGWDVDYAMTQVDDTTWESDALEMVAGGAFKVRQGASWEVNFGADGVPGGADIVIETTGTFKVVFTYDGTTATITLVPVEG
jgi:arabinogalactan oligomer/maltooligosaccharide transport system substrate-binding protein